MAAERFTFDTNILFYAIDFRDPVKHSIALNLVGRANPRRTPFLLQSFCELHNATSKQKPSMLAEAQTLTAKSRRLYQILPTELEDLTTATALYKQYPLQFFDALMLAIATRANCTTLFSEDMQHNQTYGSITVHNPFQLAPADLTALLD